MKKFKIIMVATLLLSIVVSGVMFSLMEDIIPIHFDIYGKPDQYGSKYFLLFIPGISTLCGVAMLLICRYANVSENYKKYLCLVGTILEAIFLVLIIVLSVYILNYTEDTPSFDIAKVMMFIFGPMFIILSNFMPKIEKNSTLGIKVYWSMYNEVTWQKTHRFAGFVGIVIGVLILVAGFIFKEMVNYIILMSLIGVYCLLTTIASYKYYKEEKVKENA